MLDRAEALGADLAQQISSGEPVHAAGGVVPDLVGGVVDEHEHRAAALLPCPRLGRVGRPQGVGNRDGDRALVQPLRAAAHLRRRREQPGLPGETQYALAAGADPLLAPGSVRDSVYA